MSSVQSFLDWFEGFAENIDGAPTDKQWGRVVERIKRLTVDHHQPQVQAMQPTIAAQPQTQISNANVLPSTPEQWCERFMTEMMEHGIDPESAAEYLEGAGGMNAAVMPEVKARDIARAHGML